MILKTYTAIHVVVSLLGILAGFVVMVGMITAHPLDGWTGFFLIMTIATSVTGFFFPAKHVTPAHVVGVISLVSLALAVYALYSAHLAGSWRWIYVVSAVAAQYFNVFVLIVQMFQKIPSLKLLAPTQKERPFQLAQGAVLVLFVAWGIFAGLRFHL
jgi:hypothetical protein